jgi:hypothetical protein
MDSRRRSGGRRDSRGRERNSSFHRARERFERKRKTDSYDYNSHNSYTVPGNGRGYDVPNGRGDSADSRMDYDDDRGSGRQRRSRSPPRWERGKKQQKKTQTDVPPDRELFVGNIPSDVDDKFLLHFLNGAMRQAKLCARHETPCLSAQINTGNFAFVEMLDPEYANKCLNINGVLFLNTRIKVGRPKKYVGPFVVQKSWQELTGTELTIDAVLDGESEKVNRELFVGNTTPEMTDQMLKDFFGKCDGSSRFEHHGWQSDHLVRNVWQVRIHRATNSQRNNECPESQQHRIHEFQAPNHPSRKISRSL